MDNSRKNETGDEDGDFSRQRNTNNTTVKDVQPTQSSQLQQRKSGRRKGNGVVGLRLAMSSWRVN